MLVHKNIVRCIAVSWNLQGVFCGNIDILELSEKIENKFPVNMTLYYTEKSLIT